MYLDLQDPDPFIRGADPDSFLIKVEWTEIMLAKKGF
jgi:hypothetical protein